MVVGDNGILTRAKEAKFKEALGEYKEELSIYKAGEAIDIDGMNEDAEKKPSYADNDNLIDGEITEGDIGQIIKDIKDEHKEKFIILYGTLYTTDKATEQEQKWAKEMDIEYYPLNVAVKNGNVVLECTKENVEALMEGDTLVIPGIITEIEQGTFNGVNARKIVIPGSVKIIGKDAFSNNTTLEEVVIEDGVKEIGESAFSDCSNLKKVDMQGDTIISLGGSAFRRCKLLSEVVLSNNIEIIDSDTFDACPLNDSFNLPDELKTLKGENFNGAKFKTLKFPKNLSSVSMYNNINGNSLQSIDTSENDYFNFEKNDKVLYNKDNTNLICALPSVESIDIKDTVSTISDGAFMSCNKLKTVTIPESVVEIGSSVWNNAINKIEVDIENTKFKSSNKGDLLSKDGTILYRNVQTGDVNVEAGVETILAGSFGSGITSITLPESFKSASGYNTFGTLKTLNLPKNVKTFYKSTYINVEQITVSADNPNLKMSEDNNYLLSKNEEDLYWVKKTITKIEIPTTVKNIKADAFRGCKSAGDTLTLPEGIEKLDGGNIFAYSGFKTIILPNTIKSINSEAFTVMNDLTSLIIHKSKDSIPGAPWGAPGGIKIITWNE